MQANKVKVRFKDVRQGVTIYVAHPVYGIERWNVLERPHYNPCTRSFFVKVLENGKYVNRRSLADAGITRYSNGRRAFFKLKHAKEWARIWATHKGFQKQQAEHEKYIAYFRG